MSDPGKDPVTLVLGWQDLGATEGLRRNDVGFNQIKELAAKATSNEPLVMNAFLYAFVCPAKNFDLFLHVNAELIEKPVQTIGDNLAALLAFERDGKRAGADSLFETYLRLRSVVSRRSARDERRTLATLLFSGPSTAEQVSDDLGINRNLVERIFLALEPVIERVDGETARLRTDTDTLAAVLFLLRSSLGVDPMMVLKRITKQVEG